MILSFFMVVYYYGIILYFSYANEVSSWCTFLLQKIRYATKKNKTRSVNVNVEPKSFEFPIESCIPEKVCLEEFAKRDWVSFDPLHQIAYQNTSKASELRKRARMTYGMQAGINYILTKRQLRGCINDALEMKSYLFAN